MCQKPIRVVVMVIVIVVKVCQKLGTITAEIFLMWTNVARTYVAWTNVIMTVRIC